MEKQQMIDHLANWITIKNQVLKGDFSSMVKQVIIQGGDDIAIKNSSIESNAYQCDLEINEMVESLDHLKNFEDSNA
jgi:hypothetical protein